MSTRTRSMLLLIPAVWLSACSSTPTARKLAQDAVAAMGGAEKLQGVKTLTMKDGIGTRSRMGQMVHATDQESPGQLKDVVDIVDLANGRASLDYALQNGGFMQHRHEILTKRGDRPIGIDIVGTRPIIATTPGGLFSWGTQNSPEFLLRRNVISIALSAAEFASDMQPAVDKELNGKMYKYGSGLTKSGEDVGLYFDPQTKLLAAYEVVDTESILGDVPAQYILTDYKTVDGLTLPHHITIRKGGNDYSDVQFASILVNDPAAERAFVIPESAAEEAGKAAAADEYSPMKIVKVGSGVYQAAGYSHHTLIVEFPQWLALVDSPYTETQAKVLFRAIRQQFPTKPVKYLAVSHHHYDHIGGLRTAVAMGATILVEKRHEPVVRPLLEARHTHPQDELDKRRTIVPAQPVGTTEVFEGNKIISEGGQSLALYPVSFPEHVDPMVLAYVSSARALFQPDLYTPPAAANGGPPAQHLLQAVRELNLNVDTMVGGHGGIGTWADFVKAATPAASSN
ncbi:MAG TPA: MBL fold metallo-hydrolase [Terriglobia bacterium]|nr:MBL fold metallo-hydrolase [Terriglobia bacterium]